MLLVISKLSSPIRMKLTKHLYRNGFIGAKCLSTTSSLSEVFKSQTTINMVETDVFSYMKVYAERDSDKTVVICGASGRKLTNKEVITQAVQLGTSLQERGYRKGDVAAILSPNLPEYYITLLGCAYAGLPVTLVNPLYQVCEVERQLRATNTVVFFVFASLIKTASAAKKAVPKVREIFVYGVPLKFTKMNSLVDMYARLVIGEKNTWMFDELLLPEKTRRQRSGNMSPWLPEPVQFNPSKDIFIIPYSSGTTGLPKGTCHTHATFLAYVQQLKAYEMIRRLGTGSGFLIVLPIFHIFGCAALFNCLALGGYAVMNPLFKKTMFLSSIHNYKLSILPIVPPLFHFMATDPDAYMNQKYDLSSVKSAFSGGAPMSDTLGEKFHEKFPNILVTQGFGMTEALVSGCSEAPPYTSLGKLAANNHMKLIDSKTQMECGRNEAGVIWLKGPSVFDGYLDNPEADAETFCIDEKGERWLITGDVGYIDDQDDIYLVDRLKEMIKYKGHQVSPVEVEQVLGEMDGIEDAAVAGIPHESFGEVPMAFVVRASGSSVTEEEITDYVKKNMAFQNHLRGGVVFVEEIPKSRIGKILRADLRKLLKEKIDAGELKNNIAG